MDVHSVQAVTQTDIAALYWAGRLGDKALVLRAPRRRLGGGFGDQDKYPHSWQVHVYIDGAAHVVHSARGAPREWTSLDRLERWLREQGFRSFSVRNDVEPTGGESRPDTPAHQTSYIK